MNKFRLKTKYIEEYLSELSKIVNITVERSSLSNYVTYDRIHRAEISKDYSYNIQIKFDNKDVLKNIIDELSIINGSKGVYILTEYSKYCGVLPLSSICEFNNQFNFEDEHGGIISITSFDLQNEMILDFWIEGDKKLLEIEIRGNLWTLISLSEDCQNDNETKPKTNAI